MKIHRFHAAGRVRLGILHQGLLRDAADLFVRAGETPPEVVLAADTRTLAAAADTVTVGLAEHLATKDLRLPTAPDGVTTFDPANSATVCILAPVPDPGKIICVGLNYRAHALEQGKQPPASPMLFGKFANAVAGPYDDIAIPDGLTTKVDYEAELGVVIGRGGRRISAADAMDHVLGYVAVHDVSARDLQKSDGQWLRAKGFDGFAPMGPCLVTADEIPDPQNLRLSTRLNGRTMQDSTTADMIFTVAELIAFISQGITLAPGDIISTGTPQGVGAHRTPPVFIQPGDVVEVEVEGVGTLRNRFVAEI